MLKGTNSIINVTQISGVLPVANGGTGLSSYTDGQLLIGTTAGSLAKSTLTAGSGVSIINGSGSITIANTAPDQVVSLTAGTGIAVSGAYPNFTVAATGGGTVTSVSGTGTVNGITLSGTVTSTGDLTLGGTLSGVDLTTQITGTLPVANGGTGVTTSTGSGDTVLSDKPSFDGTIGVGGAAASASGSGISFPATPSVSTDPNTLDYYDEGTCNIVISDSAGNSATMGAANVFKYVRVGSLVFVSGTMNWTDTSALAAGSRIRFTGLPFPLQATANYRAPAIIGSSMPGSFNITRAEIAGGADAGETFIYGTKVSGNNFDGPMTVADLGNSGTIYGFGVTYITDF